MKQPNSRWGYLAYNVYRHPRLSGLSRADLGVFLVSIAWCGDNLTDGFIPKSALPAILGDSPRSANRLIGCKAWERVAGGYQVHDFLDHNESKDKMQAERDAHHAASVLGGQRSAQARLEKTGSAIPAGARNSPDENHRSAEISHRSAPRSGTEAYRDRDRYGDQETVTPNSHIDTPQPSGPSPAEPSSAAGTPKSSLADPDDESDADWLKRQHRLGGYMSITLAQVKAVRQQEHERALAAAEAAAASAGDEAL